MTLYHWTDQAGHDAIQETGILQPNGPLDVVWLTEVGMPHAQSIGTDKLQYRYRVVEPSKVEKWLEAQGEYDIAIWMPYELADHARPATWWISTAPVLVELDQRV